MFRLNLKAREYKKIEDIKYVQKTEASIGVQENLLRYLTMLYAISRTRRTFRSDRRRIFLGRRHPARR